MGGYADWEGNLTSEMTFTRTYGRWQFPQLYHTFSGERRPLPPRPPQAARRRKHHTAAAAGSDLRADAVPALSLPLPRAQWS